MYGAIIGDIIGSRFEFDRGNKSKDFELFTKECDFTDDTVMTIAVAEALMDAGPDADEKTIKDLLIKSMKKWGKKYPHAGYGARFIDWVLTDDPKPYGSYGNGSGMRVSPVGWLYDTLDRTREVARWTAEVTHNHPEGIKGAEATAAAIFMARTGSKMEEIAGYTGDVMIIHGLGDKTVPYTYSMEAISTAYAEAASELVLITGKKSVHGFEMIYDQGREYALSTGVDFLSRHVG